MSFISRRLNSPEKVKRFISVDPQVLNMVYGYRHNNGNRQLIAVPFKLYPGGKYDIKGPDLGKCSTCGTDYTLIKRYFPMPREERKNPVDAATAYIMHCLCGNAKFLFEEASDEEVDCYIKEHGSIPKYEDVKAIPVPQ